MVEAVARERNIPVVGILAMLEAESALNPFAERWGDRTKAAKAAIGDRAGLAAIVADLEERGLGADISFGYSQLVVKTAGAYGIGDGSNRVDNILHVRERLFDRATSIDLGARHYAWCLQYVRQHKALVTLDQWLLDSLVVYNGGTWAFWNYDEWVKSWAANVWNYRSALAWAHRMIGDGQ